MASSSSLKPSATVSAAKEIIGFENMPHVNYKTAYPLTNAQFVRRLAIALTRTPATVALIAMGIQYYSGICDFSNNAASASAFSPAIPFTANELLFGVENAAEKAGTLALFPHILGDFSPAFHFGLFVSVARTLMAIICHTFYGLIEKYHILEHYKIPRTAQTEPSMELRIENYKAYLVEFCMGPLAVWFLTHFGIIRQVNDVCQPIAFLPTMLFIATCFFVNETLFYWSHRMLHEVPFLYRTVHKQHHRYIGSISIAAEFAHPVEGAISNALPLVAVLFVVPVAPIVFAVWVVFRLMETFESHSGYCFDGSFLSERLNMTHSGYTLFHDFHHVANKGNYGQGGLFWDYVMGTDKLFRTKMAAAGDRKARLAKQKAL